MELLISHDSTRGSPLVEVVNYKKGIDTTNGASHNNIEFNENYNFPSM